MIVYKNGMKPSGLMSSTVNWIACSMIFMHWRKFPFALFTVWQRAHLHTFSSKCFYVYKELNGTFGHLYGYNTE